MFPEESDKFEKYVGGLSDMIYESVMASKTKTIQDAVKFETELMDKKIHTFAEPSRAANTLATPWSISALSWASVARIVEVVAVAGDDLVVLFGAISSITRKYNTR
nr:hypothetical protein [Tanacetum cinerariifolium]